MLAKRYLLTAIALLVAFAATMAQKEERAYVRKANRLYNDSSYVASETLYRKAIDTNMKSFAAHNNLGNNLMQSRNYTEAAKEYARAIEYAPGKQELAQAYYNLGVAFQKQQMYKECINAYKSALRNDPNNNDAKYNLTKALMMQEEQEEQDNQDDQQQDNQEQQQQNEQNNQNDNQDQSEQNEQQNQDNQQDQQQQQQEEMSMENAEQMLNSIMEDEKRISEQVQQKINKAQARDLENNW